MVGSKTEPATHLRTDVIDKKIDYLIKYYPTVKAAYIAQTLGCPVSTVYRIAAKYGLKKSDEFFKSKKSGRTDGNRGSLTRFKKGQTPWNKGKKYNSGGRSAETHFKKGRPPQEARNYRPIGSTRVSKDGYLEIKISDDHPTPARRWKAAHRVVWEREHGPVPDGHVVVFKPGMKTMDPEQITIDRIDCITRAENMKRNTIHRYSPEVKSAIRAVAKLTKGIKRHEQNTN